jgi:PhnB protein
MSKRSVPKGFHTITPNIIVDDAEKAVAFLKEAFGVTENYRLTLANGKITHCELKLALPSHF